MRIYTDLDMVEQLGYGVSRISRAYPKDCFKFSHNYLRMTFPRSVVEEENLSPSSLKGVLVEGLADSQNKILKLIETNPNISKHEMADAIGISTTAIDENILVLKNIIKRAGK